MADRTENRDNPFHGLWRFTRRFTVVFYRFHTAFLVGFTGQKTASRDKYKTIRIWKRSEQ